MSGTYNFLHKEDRFHMGKCGGDLVVEWVCPKFKKVAGGFIVAGPEAARNLAKRLTWYAEQVEAQLWEDSSPKKRTTSSKRLKKKTTSSQKSSRT